MTGHTSLRKVLVANRGEIAVRILRTARELGLRTVAVASDADADALHTALADEVVHIGPAPARESYLNVERLLHAAATTRADSVHPGYGFVSENAGFARACAEAGLVFIGPPADAIELMGNKRRARQAMRAAGVPCIPGFEPEGIDDMALAARTEALGYPVMIKAADGGGGRGMRRVDDAATLAAQLAEARSEAESAFGSAELIVERLVQAARHIEVQVFADRHGNVIHLGERDCSVQRRHQKIVEESPSPVVDAALRTRMGEAAVTAARACGYVGAGTVEFLVDADGAFYFLEMNTRLQVEHPVTEAITGLDLVAWQFAIAAGDRLPLAQRDVRFDGHAVEVRVYAEDPRNAFLPQTGTVEHWYVPQRPGIRVDTGIRVGQFVGSHYDPLVAKIVAHGPDRAAAVRRLSTVLAGTRLLGIDNNLSFLRAVVDHPVFAGGRATTAFVENEMHEPTESVAPPATLTARAAVLYYLRGRMRAAPFPAGSWHGSAVPAEIELTCRDHVMRATVSVAAGGYRVGIDGAFVELTAPDEPIDDVGRIVLGSGSLRTSVAYVFRGSALIIDDGTGQHRYEDRSGRNSASAPAAGDGRVVAGSDGLVVAVSVTVGERVDRGQPVAIVEAMKMQHRVLATASGIVSGVEVADGRQVRAGQLLVRIEPD